VLLHAGEASASGSLKDAEIAKAIHTSRLTVEWVVFTNREMSLK